MLIYQNLITKLKLYIMLSPSSEMDVHHQGSLSTPVQLIWILTMAKEEEAKHNMSTATVINELHRW